MGEIIREKIEANILTTLQSMNVANGYSNDWGDVERWKQHGNSTVNVPYAHIVPGPETKSEYPVGYLTCEIALEICIGTRQSESSTDPSGKILNSLIGDVITALNVDPTRGGNVEDTKILEIIPFDTVDGGREFGVFISVKVIYEHLETDPEN